jgi:hypothetical protein
MSRFCRDLVQVQQLMAVVDEYAAAASILVLIEGTTISDTDQPTMNSAEITTCTGLW